MSAKQEGGARLSTFIWLIIFAVVVYVAFNIVPVYYANYSFDDRLLEITRTFRFKANDDQLLDMIVKAARETGLDGYITRTSCRVVTDTNRRIITCHYTREANILPGFPHLFVFDLKKDEPIV
jgi:hypothetical protein